MVLRWLENDFFNTGILTAHRTFPDILFSMRKDNPL